MCLMLTAVTWVRKTFYTIHNQKKKLLNIYLFEFEFFVYFFLFEIFSELNYNRKKTCMDNINNNIFRQHYFRIYQNAKNLFEFGGEKKIF